ncbi:MAG: hypothetical protein JW910_20015 [Anaerolineae bacterium]|nr:hypothetical protein [Anaerolineae bacterium]
MSTFPEIPEVTLTRAQRFAQFFTLLVAVLGLALGFLLKSQVLGATQSFRDLAAGVQAQYPANWLLDSGDEYVFRVRDPLSSGFPTTFQVSVISIGDDAAARNIVDNQSLERARTLAAYRVLPPDPTFVLPDGSAATWLEYFYVDTESNPFLETSPSVVHGVDVVAIERGQAIIITFRVEATRFDEELSRFEQFLAALDF